MHVVPATGSARTRRGRKPPSPFFGTVDVRAFATAVLAALACGACSIDYDRYVGAGARDVGPGRDAGSDLATPDAGSDASDPGDAGADAREQDMGDDDAGSSDGGCVPRRPPPRPSLEDGDDTPLRYFAMRALRVGSGESWRTLGYDLDGLCTALDSPLSQLGCAPRMAAAGFGPLADAPEGLDNAYGQTFVPLVLLVYPMFEAQLNAAFETGIVGVLIRVAGWNGSPDDPVVDVALVEGVGLASTGDAAAPAPRWDGSDRWVVADRAFASGDLSRPLARDSAAYVAGGLLVARPRDGTEVHLPAGLAQDLAIRLEGMVLTARLAAFGAALEGGIVAGSWRLDDVFAALPGLGVCTDHMLYEATTTALSRNADVRGGGRVAPELECDALSVGFGFEAERIHEDVVVGRGNEREDTCRRRDAGTGRHR